MLFRSPGEEVIIPDPSFVSYHSLIKNNKSKTVRIPLHERNEFRLDPKDIKKAVTDKTRMIIINSPSNPTGAVMNEREMREVYEIAEANDIYLLSDEVYTKMIYEDSDTKFSSPSKYDRCKERTLVVNSFSKSYAMTGWRLGGVVGPPDLIGKMALLLESEISCVSPFIQRAGIEALKGSQEPISDMVKEFKKRRDTVVEGLNSLLGVKCINPKGAFYAFPNIKETKLTSQEFADIMLDEAGIALCPGTIFGEYGEGYVRLCYANSIENINSGVERMRYVLRNPKVVDNYFKIGKKEKIRKQNIPPN